MIVNASEIASRAYDGTIVPDESTLTGYGFAPTMGCCAIR